MKQALSKLNFIELYQLFESHQSSFQHQIFGEEEEEEEEELNKSNLISSRDNLIQEANQRNVISRSQPKGTPLSKTNILTFHCFQTNLTDECLFLLKKHFLRQNSEIVDSNNEMKHWLQDSAKKTPRSQSKSKTSSQITTTTTTTTSTTSASSTTKKHESPELHTLQVTQLPKTPQKSTPIQQKQQHKVNRNTSQSQLQLQESHRPKPPLVQQHLEIQLQRLRNTPQIQVPQSYLQQLQQTLQSPSKNSIPPRQQIHQPDQSQRERPTKRERTKNSDQGNVSVLEPSEEENNVLNKKRKIETAQPSHLDVKNRSGRIQEYVKVKINFLQIYFAKSPKKLPEMVARSNYRIENTNQAVDRNSNQNVHSENLTSHSARMALKSYLL